MQWPAWRKELYATAVAELENWKQEQMPDDVAGGAGGAGGRGDFQRESDGTIRSRSGKEIHPDMLEYDNVAVVGDGGGEE